MTLHRIPAALFFLVAAMTTTLIATPGPLHAHEDPIEHELHVLVDEFLEGASTNDIETHDRFWAEDLVYTSSAGERFGKDEIMDGLRASAGEGASDDSRDESLPRYRGEDLNIRVFGDLAVVTFRLVADMPDESVAEYFNTGVFRKNDDAWKSFTWHATRIPDVAEES